MSKKKRLKKIVKGKLNRVLATGVKSLTTASAQQSALAVMDSIAKAGGDGAGEGSGDGLLLDVIGIANPGNPLTETLNIDEDARTFATDFDDLDATEVRDTDNDNIGDNRDIILNKIALDVILKAKDHTDAAVNPNTGTMKDLAVRLANAKTDLEAAAALGTAELREARLAALRAGTHGGQVVLAADCTKAALATILASVNTQKAEANALKAEIAAATATAGVTILDGTGDYNGSGASVIAVTGAAAVDADTLATAAASDKSDCDTALDTIEP